MRVAPRIFIALALIGFALMATGHAATAQELDVVSIAAGQALGLDALQRWDATVYGIERTGELVVMSRRSDASLESRTHEYLAQYHAGIPVHGGGVSRQLDGSGVTVSLFGTLHQGIAVDTTPALSGAEVAALLEVMHGGEFVADRQPPLSILPRPDGSYVLAYQVAMSDGHFYFVGAANGKLLHRVHALKSQSAVGVGADSTGMRRKLSTTQGGTGFGAYDRMRPGEIVTLDARFDLLRASYLLFGHLFNQMPPGEPLWTMDDVAADADNEWADPSVVGAHVYSGWTYDYFFGRHGWEGIDGANGRTITMVNIDEDNAFFAPPPFGPEGRGIFVFGQAIDETSEDPLTELDIVGHELMHGVTHFSVSNRTGSPFGLSNPFPLDARLGPESFTDVDGETYTCSTARFPGLVETMEGPEEGLVPAWCVDGRFLLAYSGDGAIQEAYSDIFGESLEFFYESQGATADYLVGGETKRGPIRSLSDPKSLRDGFYPDVYRDRYEFALTLDEDENWDYSGFVFVDGQYIDSTDDFGYGAEHWNSLILSHAYYLAVEGGTHRTNGMTVEGIGGTNREEMERIFFHAMRDLMPAAASLPIAAAVLRQAALDLAPGSEAERALDQALHAVGLLPDTEGLQE